MHRLPALILAALLAACGGSTADADRTAAPDPLRDTSEARATASPAGPAAGAGRSSEGAIRYPATRTGEQVDVYHGTRVADPYRWLEADVREAPEVAAWVAAQNEVTFRYLDRLEARGAIRERLETLWNYEKYGLPVEAGGRYFFRRNDGLQSQDVVYVQASLDAEPRALIDPNRWSEDGTVALASFEVSPDGRLIAQAIQDGGSDWRTVRVFDVEGGRELEDELRWLKFSPIAWSADSQGFYYARYPAPGDGETFQSPNRDQRVYYHRIGTPQAEDELVYAAPEHPDWGFSPRVTDDGRYLVITIWKGTDARYQVAYLDLARDGARPVMLVEGFDHDYTFAGNDGARFFFRTDLDAPRGRLVAVDVDARAEGWKQVLPERESVLEYARLIGGRLVAGFLRDARDEVEIFTLAGEPLRTVELAGIGSVSGFEGRSDDPETFYAFSSFNAPPTIYRYDVATGEARVFKAAEVPFAPEDYVVEQVFFESRDGTRVPMFVTHRRGIELTGNNPTLLYGYGGFAISLTPSFSVTRLAWLELGGVYAVANLRGGGEYGKAWHQAGTKLRKQNVFDDFIAAAEYLIEARYTRPGKLAVMGGSNGGLLVGAVVNQRPDLFGAALPAVGVMDMLRFHRFTAGRFWVDDYGSAEDPEEFAALYAYSPYHNIREGVRYPAVLVTTADTDDRVVPGHSFKYAARIQAAQAGPDPVLIRVETRAGHGSGKPTEKIIDGYADRWAFLVENLEVELPEGYGR